MAKPSKPWFRASKQAWYATVEGRKVSLGVKGRENETEAVKAWHRLMAGVTEKAKPKPKQEPTVAEVVKGFLADVEGRAKPNTNRVYRYFLRPFAKRHGKAKASELTPPVAEAHARQQAHWSDSSRNAFLGALATAFKWAERSRIIDRTPLAGLKRPPKASRGAEAVVSPEDHARLLNAAGGHFKPFLRLLFLTGARPGEVARIDADNFDPEASCVRLKEHKSAHKGKSRTIFLCPEAVALLRELKAKHGEGRLLRNALGKPWSEKALVKAMIAVRKRAGLAKAVAYGYRHGFATDALANGVPDAHVAELLGHSGTAMLHRHYAHLTARSQALREALGKVR